VIASELSETLGRPFSTCEFDELSERSLGAAANLSVAAIESVLRDDPRFAPPPPEWKRQADYRLPLPGAETLVEAGSRVAKHILARAAALGRSQLKLFVGHGGAFRHAAQQLGLLEPAHVASLSMLHCTPLYFEIESQPGEPSRLVHLAGDWNERTEDAPRD
jgi:broad specificity phosphatase PhoE